MYAIGANDSAIPGRIMSLIVPHPPTGNQCVIAAIISSTAATTNPGTLMPTSAITRLIQSSAPPRFTAAIVPIPTPNGTAINIANNPSATDTGNDDRMISATDHSLCTNDGPKSPTMTFFG